MFIDSSSTHKKTKKTRIYDKNGNFWFPFKDFENYQKIENNISFRSSFKSEIVSNLTAASGI